MLVIYGLKFFVYRVDLEKHYLYYRKPYKGELGLESYEDWQIPDYALVRTYLTYG